MNIIASLYSKHFERVGVTNLGQLILIYLENTACHLQDFQYLTGLIPPLQEKSLRSFAFGGELRLDKGGASMRVPNFTVGRIGFYHEPVNWDLLKYL